MTYSTPTHKKRQVDDGATEQKQYTERLLDNRAFFRICADIATLERTLDAALQFDAILRLLESPATRWIKSERVRKVLETWEQEELDEKPESFEENA